jgi:hypothetical protein
MGSRHGFAFGLLLCSQVAFADGNAVGFRLGMLGLGVEYARELSDRIAIRAAVNGSGFSTDSTESGIHYEFDLDFDSFALGIDVHPKRGPLRVSFGVLANDSKIAAEASANQTLEIGGTIYNATEIGTLRGDVSFDGTAPYAGLGWDWSRSKRFGVAFDLGVVRQGGPRVVLSATGPAADNPEFLANLAAEERDLAASLDDLDLYPYASLGFVFRF